jgi:hypothetical protein
MVVDGIVRRDFSYLNDTDQRHLAVLSDQAVDMWRESRRNGHTPSALAKVDAVMADLLLAINGKYEDKLQDERRKAKQQAK